MHCAHVPPPPQAEGTKILRSASVESSVPPELTSTAFASSPLMTILTLPLLTSCPLAMRRMITIARMTKVNMPTPRRIVSIRFGSLRRS